MTQRVNIATQFVPHHQNSAETRYRLVDRSQTNRYYGADRQDFEALQCSMALFINLNDSQH